MFNIFLGEYNDMIFIIEIGYNKVVNIVKVSPLE